MSRLFIVSLALCFALSSPVRGQEEAAETKPTFNKAAADIKKKLEASILELTKLREQIVSEKVPMNRELGKVQAELVEVRKEQRKVTRELDRSALDLSNLQKAIKRLEKDASYLSSFLGDYIREFEARLHIAELKRYEEIVRAAGMAPEQDDLTQDQAFRAQAAVLTASLDRLEDALGGARFEGTAVDGDGIVHEGTFLLVGPAALFRSKDGSCVGTSAQKLGSLEPAATAYGQPQHSAAAGVVVAQGEGFFPLDPTLGNAHKIEATEETLLEHVKKGGPVMVPIFAMAGLGLLIALYKWLTMVFIRKPGKRKVRSLLDAVEGRDHDRAREISHAMKGPVGKMLAAGSDHLVEPRELIEEVMYEKVLTARLSLQRLLPFIAICAASAPLLGLLGTVTGIINTFKMITVFGSGDVKSLSGGISEALITTKFGLIVAIPSLLLHAFLSRKARSVVGQMETAAMSFVNSVSRSVTLGRGRSEPLATLSSSDEPDRPADMGPTRARVANA